MARVRYTFLIALLLTTECESFGIISLHNPWRHVPLFGIRVYTMWFTWLSLSLLHKGYTERHCQSFIYNWVIILKTYKVWRVSRLQMQILYPLVATNSSWIVRLWTKMKISSPLKYFLMAGCGLVLSSFTLSQDLLSSFNAQTRNGQFDHR